MDDDGSRTLNYEELRKGLHDYGLSLENKVHLIIIDDYHYKYIRSYHKY